MATPEESQQHARDAMDPALLREGLDRAGEFVRGYWSSLHDASAQVPVLSQARPGDIASRMPDAAPEQGERDWDAIFKDLREIVAPGLTHWQHPSFFAFFPSNISVPAVVGELLSAGLGVQGMLWATSPAATEVETRVLDWMGRAVGLPSTFLSSSATGGGVLQGTASEAALVAICAARHRAAIDVGTPRPITLYASSQAHSSIVKAAMIAGLANSPEDRTSVRQISPDAKLRMDPTALGESLRADWARGLRPAFVCATVGTTSTTAIDDVEAIARVVRASTPAGEKPPWLHVDAAHAGAACVCPEYQWWLRGVDAADSLCFNPHKWLLTNFDCDCFWTSDRASVTGALSITPEYLRNHASEMGAVTDYRDWQVPLGRRFRSLKLWLVLRWFGIDGLRAFVRSHIDMAQEFERLVLGDARFEVVAERTMNLVCFRLLPKPGEAPSRTDARNRDLLARINASGRAYLTHTIIPCANIPGTSMYVLRMAIGAVLTQAQHVRDAWALIQQLADEPTDDA